MPEVVLRHPDLPNQPIVVDVQEGGYVARSYKDSGWQIDSNTDPDDAREEHAEPRATEPFVASFEPDDVQSEPVAAPEPPAPVPPAEPVQSEQPLESHEEI